MVLCALLAVSCSNGTPVKNDNNKSQENYKKSLSDSIEAVKNEIDSCNEQISLLRNNASEWLRDFSTVANPREAGAYMIMTSARNHYPLHSTGIIARLNDSGQFELIAALSGKPFDCISITSGVHTATTAVVPNDQALNYRSEGLTTVAFTGAEADSVGKLISENQLNPLTINYLNGGGTVQSSKVNNSEAKVVAYTYMLYDLDSQIKRLEQRVPLLQEKMKILRVHRDKL